MTTPPSQRLRDLARLRRVRDRIEHWGLVGMRERMARVGGTLAVGPGDGAGVLVRFAIPAGRAYEG